ncbi:hypothetical protein LTR53_009514, partial [Teratosphaeriaceae sp. CCFEE 6253]
MKTAADLSTANTDHGPDVVDGRLFVRRSAQPRDRNPGSADDVPRSTLHMTTKREYRDPNSLYDTGGNFE